MKALITINRAAGLAAGLIAGVALTMPAPATAQIGLGRSVNGVAGATVSNASYLHGCTVGQAVAGSTASVLFTHGIGFWFTMDRALSSAPELPPAVPIAFALSLAGANPSSSGTRIAYAVPVSAQVTIRLFDIAGREVRALVAGRVEPGCHEEDLGASGLGGGVYFCRMDAPGFSATRKLVLLR